MKKMILSFLMMAMSVTLFAQYASIDSVTEQHNIRNGYYNGMVVNVKFDTGEIQDERVDVYLKFYYGDNTTPLHDRNGYNLSTKNSVIPRYEYSTCSVSFYVPYVNLNMAPGFYNLTYDVVVKNRNGEVLDTSYNHGFSLSI